MDRQLALLKDAPDVDQLLSRQQQAADAAWARFAARHPKKVAKARALLKRWGSAEHVREQTRSEVVRAFWVVRAFALRAGELTGLGDDVFFLTVGEVLDALDGGQPRTDLVPKRRRTYDRYVRLPAYPAFIRGAFDPGRWAADPARRTDFFDAHRAPLPASGVVRGFPGSVGVVEGTARVIRSPDDAGELANGEILVTTITNIGWTPVFPRAAAVVTDVGAPLSHAAIVARELGIPAVVGCGDATMLIRTGDRLRVDGGEGTVEILRRHQDVPALGGAGGARRGRERGHVVASRDCSAATSKTASGQVRSMPLRASMSRCCTASRAYHFLSAGTTNQGAAAVAVRSSATWYAP